VALRQVAGGDRKAFEEVYRLTSAKLFGVCLRILPTRHEAEEAAQEVYMAAWQKAASFDEGRGTAMTWLITLARNRAVDRLRSSGKVMTAPLEHADGLADPTPLASETAEAADTDRRLLDCMATLEGRDADYIRTAFFQGSTYSELAARSSTPVGTMKSRIRRALLKLRECLQ
jgi:RNA polymerase sigma-70 factor (ECF subfamily)